MVHKANIKRCVVDDEFSAGDKLVLFYNSANRDEEIFESPKLFDVTRDPNPHVGFGGPGPHFCLGAHLARREITVMYRELSMPPSGAVSLFVLVRLVDGNIAQMPM